MLSHLCILYLDFYLYLVYTLHMYHLYLYLIYVAFQHQIVVKLILKLNISIPGQEQFPSDGARRSFSCKVPTQPMFLTHCWLVVTGRRIQVEATCLQSLILQGRGRLVKVFLSSDNLKPIWHNLKISTLVSLILLSCHDNLSCSCFWYFRIRNALTRVGQMSFQIIICHPTWMYFDLLLSSLIYYIHQCCAVTLQCN